MKILARYIRRSIPGALALAALSLFSTIALAATVDATYSAATNVPVTASGYTPTGNTVNFTLNFAPATGTALMVVQNTELGFINGTFDNLTNGQPVSLSYGGTNYHFVANYYGGSGNDLVLTWANNRAFAWGGNDFGQLGDSTTTNRLLPVPVVATGLLANQTLVSVVACGEHSLALCSDGTVAAWGGNSGGELGDGTQTDRYSPVAVNTGPGSALYGKTVVAIAGGVSHSLALCSDGTVAAWGYNHYGSLGDNSTTHRFVPVAVKTTSGLSALYGKTVVAIAVEGYHSLALCSDGTVVAWGENNFGQLGNNTMNDSPVPVAVNTAPGISALYGKKVVAIAAGSLHSMALCSDGTVAAWGHNNLGQLGDGSINADPPNGKAVPVAVNTSSGTSALFGKQVVAIAAGGHHSLALCSDGTLAAWGLNAQGQLGDNTQTNHPVPVEVNKDSGVSALYGKTVVDIAAGGWDSVALCLDGTVTAWGYNAYGQVGDDTLTNRLAPVAVNTALLSAGERVIRVSSSSSYWHNLALVAAPLHPAISVSGNGTSISNGDTTPTLADGTEFGSALVGSGTAVRTFTIQNTGPAPLSLVATPKVAVSGPHAADFSVTRQPASPLAGDGGSTSFEVTFAPGAPRLRIATITIASDDNDQNPYVFDIQGTGAGVLDASYSTGTDVPLTTSEFTAVGSTVNLTLNFAPTPGTDLVVVKTTGPAFINGTFDNLTNGQPVALTYGGVTFNFVANYYGGSGNDLVLVWASNRAFAWGWNNYGQLGDNTSGTNRLLPVPVTATGVLAGKTLVALAASQLHSLALCSDGTLAAWGGNGAGELGDNRAAGAQSLAPVAVNTALGVSALYGKRVVAIAAGLLHSLALCSDGTVAAWGFNSYGQLGDNTTTSRPVPVAVNTAAGFSALFGKTVVAIAAGAEYSLALCSDGTVAAWGYNFGGQLGDNTRTNRFVPVAVNTASDLSALFGKTVVAIAAGSYQSLALCSDGTVAAWGGNDNGELGDNTTTAHPVPVAVNTAPGVSALWGKRVSAIASGYYHSLALCSDGTLAAWGSNETAHLETTLPRDALCRWRWTRIRASRCSIAKR